MGIEGGSEWVGEREGVSVEGVGVEGGSGGGE